MEIGTMENQIRRYVHDSGNALREIGRIAKIELTQPDSENERVKSAKALFNVAAQNFVLAQREMPEGLAAQFISQGLQQMSAAAKNLLPYAGNMGNFRRALYDQPRIDYLRKSATGLTYFCYGMSGVPLSRGYSASITS
jgi:hypothetical protein